MLRSRVYIGEGNKFYFLLKNGVKRVKNGGKTNLNSQKKIIKKKPNVKEVK